MEQYTVTGMSCAACQARVEKAVSKVDGVDSCSVSLLTNSMGVEGNASPEDIIRAVENAGYGARLKADDAARDTARGSFAAEEAALEDIETPALKKRLIASSKMLILCEKLRDMHAGLYGYEPRLGAGELADFIRLEYSRIGADQNITPREVIRDFIELLDLLYQHPEQTLAGLLQSENFAFAKSEAVSDQTEAGYAEFTL